MNNSYDNIPTVADPVWAQGVSARAAFIIKTYLHLFGAIIAFTLIEVAVFSSGSAETITNMFPNNWLVVLGIFMVASWIARSAAHRANSLAIQYAALCLFVLAWAIIFIPILHIADRYYPGVLPNAVLATLLGFSGLTAIAFYTRKDFSFLRSILMWGGLCALVLIVCGAIFGFTLGPLFSVAMICLAGGSILYDTSNVMHHHPEDRYVAASLELFASVALMFWYVIRLLMSLSRD